jgi:hypothetical protein
MLFASAHFAADLDLNSMEGLPGLAVNAPSIFSVLMETRPTTRQVLI